MSPPMNRHIYKPPQSEGRPHGGIFSVPEEQDEEDLHHQRMSLKRYTEENLRSHDKESNKQMRLT